MDNINASPRRIELAGLEVEICDGEVRLCSDRDPLRPVWLTVEQLRAIAAAAEGRWSR